MTNDNIPAGYNDEGNLEGSEPITDREDNGDYGNDFDDDALPEDVATGNSPLMEYDLVTLDDMREFLIDKYVEEEMGYVDDPDIAEDRGVERIRYMTDKDIADAYVQYFTKLAIKNNEKYQTEVIE
jgi:hypothetical protein